MRFGDGIDPFATSPSNVVADTPTYRAEVSRDKSNARKQSVGAGVVSVIGLRDIGISGLVELQNDGG
jgi:hypothetical protein